MQFKIESFNTLQFNNTNLNIRFHNNKEKGFIVTFSWSFLRRLEPFFCRFRWKNCIMIILFRSRREFWPPQQLWSLLVTPRQHRMTTPVVTWNTSRLTLAIASASLGPVWKHIFWKNPGSYLGQSSNGHDWSIAITKEIFLFKHVLTNSLRSFKTFFGQG